MTETTADDMKWHDTSVYWPNDGHRLWQSWKVTNGFATISVTESLRDGMFCTYDARNWQNFRWKTLDEAKAYAESLLR